MVLASRLNQVRMWRALRLLPLLLLHGACPRNHDRSTIDQDRYPKFHSKRRDTDHPGSSCHGDCIRREARQDVHFLLFESTDRSLFAFIHSVFSVPPIRPSRRIRRHTADSIERHVLLCTPYPLHEDKLRLSQISCVVRALDECRQL